MCAGNMQKNMKKDPKPNLSKAALAATMIYWQAQAAQGYKKATNANLQMSKIYDAKDKSWHSPKPSSKPS